MNCWRQAKCFWRGRAARARRRDAGSNVPNVSTDVSFAPASRCAVLMSRAFRLMRFSSAPIVSPTPARMSARSRRFSRRTTPSSTSQGKRTGNCAWFTPDRTIRRAFSRTAAGKLVPPGRASGPPSGPLVFHSNSAAYIHLPRRNPATNCETLAGFSPQTAKYA